MSAQPDDAMVVLLRFHGRSDELSRVAEDKRLKHSDREAVEAAQTACMLAASRIERDAATIASRDAEISRLRTAIIKAAADLATGRLLPELPEGKPLGWRQIARIEDAAAEKHRLAAIALRAVYDGAAIPSPDGAAG